MTKSKLIVGVLVTAFALGATIEVASATAGHSARHAVRAAHVKPTTYDSSPPNYCGKGAVPILHTMNPAHLYWGCVDANGKTVTAHRGNLSSRHH
jgi:hypothetical protein